MSVVIETTIGDLTVDLFTDERPVACLNFVKLCKLKYYNFNLFHTIEQGFIAQTGDPTGAGDGGSSLWGVVEGHHKRFFEAESLPKINHTTIGLLSLVGAGKHLVGSQFFFTLGENLSSLDGQHCVIGEVVEGFDILRKLNEAIVDEKFRPYQDIRITHTVILEDPFPDPRAYRIPSHSPSPSADRLKNGRIAADEDIDDTEGKSMEEIQEMLAEREAKARATILEIVGDLPDAEMAPPENVLFVCKLNPVTTDDDLEIIFSRFGKVKGCEVIRDRKTGDSLQYAFVEFEEQKSCEAAYFKMDNVLIDDRRIHVDFSQSVSKVKWRGRGRGIEGNWKELDFNNLRENENRNGNTIRNYEKGVNLNPNMRKRSRGGNFARRSRSLSRERIRQTPTERRRPQEECYRNKEERKIKTRSRSRNRLTEMIKTRSKSRNRSTERIKTRSRSRNRSTERIKYFNKLLEVQKPREKSRSTNRDDRRERSKSHSRSKHRKREYTPERRTTYSRHDLERPKESARRGSVKHMSPNNSEIQNRFAERKSEYNSRAHNVENRTRKQKKPKKKHRKKSKHETSSDESSDSDTTSESSKTSSEQYFGSKTKEKVKKIKSKKKKINKHKK